MDAAVGAPGLSGGCTAIGRPRSEPDDLALLATQATVAAVGVEHGSCALTDSRRIAVRITVPHRRHA